MAPCAFAAVAAVSSEMGRVFFSAEKQHNGLHTVFFLQELRGVLAVGALEDFNGLVERCCHALFS